MRRSLRSDCMGSFGHYSLRPSRWQLASLVLKVLLGTAAAADAAVSGIGRDSQQSLSLQDPAPLAGITGYPATALLADGCSSLSDQDCFQAYRDFSGMPVANPFLPPGASSPNDVEHQQVMREQPSNSGSAGVVLSGLFALAGVGAVRSARQWNVAALPAWYHAGAPVQIGHTVAYDLEQPLLACWYDATLQSAAPRPVFHTHLRERDTRRDSQVFLILSAPRGPPALV